MAMAESRRSTKRKLERAVSVPEHVIFEKNPYFPDLLNEPDVLVVPRLGRLVAVYLYSTRQPLSWRTVLPAIEDLFEIKLTAGESTVVIAALGAASEDVTDNHLLTFLSSMFDGLIQPRAFRDERELRHLLLQATGNAPPRSNLFEFWRLERQRVSNNLENFAEDRYAQFVDERRRSRWRQQHVVQAFAELIGRTALSRRIRYDVPVPTPKEAVAGLPSRSRFHFDFAIEQDGVTRVFDIVSVGRYGSRPRLRSLMTKARFVSYTLEGGFLHFQQNPVRPVLLVDGSLAGPSHDPYRYVRALRSVGWEIEEASPEAMLRMADAHV